MGTCCSTSAAPCPNKALLSAPISCYFMTKQARSTNTVPAEQAAGHCDNPGQPDTGPNSKQQQRQQQQHRQQQRQQHNGFHKQPAPDAQQQQQQLATAVSPTSKRKAPAAAGATHKSKHKKHQHQSVTQQPGRDINNEPEQPGQAPIAAAVAAASTVPGAAAAGTAAAVAVSDPKDDEVRRLFRSWAWKREHRWAVGLVHLILSYHGESCKQLGGRPSWYMVCQLWCSCVPKATRSSQCR